MTELPPPANRVEIHNRRLEFRCFHRDDGLWDIEATLLDTKPYVVRRKHGQHEAGEPIHRMKVCLTINDDMIVQDIAAVMENTPYAECVSAVEPMRAVIGLTMGAGWRRAVDGVLGGIVGCTHMRELLYNAATVAYQSLPSHRAHLTKTSEHGSDLSPPPHLDKCKSWAIDGPVVKRELPQFYRPDRSLTDHGLPSSPRTQNGD